MSSTNLKTGAAVILAGSLLVATSSRVSAHGFGARYDLPVPLSLYALGAAAAVALSFVIAGVFLKTRRSPDAYARLNLLEVPFLRPLFSAPVAWLLAIIGVGVLFAVIIAGFAGTPIPSRNLAPTVVWVLWWVGFAYLSALVGNLWVAFNPWSGLFLALDKVFRRIMLGGSLSLNLAYPTEWRRWPAAILFLVFAWLESAFTGASSPSAIAGFATAYTLITLAGMVLFGRHVWLRNGEAFTVAFGLLARFSPTEFRVNDLTICSRCSADCWNESGDCVDCQECYERAGRNDREINLRPYAAGLLRTSRTSISEVAFVLILLATVSFDGFTATSAWVWFVDNVTPTFSFYGQNAGTAVNSVGLAIAIAGFAGIYWLFVRLIILNSGEDHRANDIARSFVLSLVPIALAYHLSHFLSFLFLQGQLIIPLVSNPLGNGWDIFGTADYVGSLSLVSARFAWIFAVAAIVIGHVAAVFLSHFTAMRTFGTHKAAVTSQYPMLVLMISYTMASLWILAQPIVNAE